MGKTPLKRDIKYWLGQVYGMAIINLAVWIFLLEPCLDWVRLFS